MTCPAWQGAKRGESQITHTEFTLWLTPSEPLRSTLRSIIRNLATTLDAVQFEPHVTVYCGASTDAQARRVAQRIATNFAPIELTTDRLHHTESYTKTLFVQFHDDDAGRQMFEAARPYSPESSYVFSPHLSLLYKKMPEAQRHELAQSIEYPKGVYTFDRVRLIETELPIEDQGPVLRWRTVLDAPIAGE